MSEKKIVSISEDGVLRQWNPSTGLLTSEIKIGSSENVHPSDFGVIAGEEVYLLKRNKGKAEDLVLFRKFGR